MRRISASDIAFTAIRIVFVAAIAVTIVCRFATNGAVTTISISEVTSLSGEQPPTNSEISSETSCEREPLDINTATVSQLTCLNGIGDTKAEAIVEYRRQHGDFSGIDELTNVPGIGEKILDGIRNSITVSNSAPQTSPSQTTAQPSPPETSVSQAKTQSYGSEPVTINSAASQTAAETASQTAEPQTTAENSVSVGIININTATASQLTALDGIGEKKAAAIVEYRRQHGAFSSVDELINVSGIGEKILDDIRAYITVGDYAPQNAAVQTTSAQTTAENSDSGGLININTATASQLTALNGIGEKKAAAIVEYRRQHGNFSSVDELINVSGIGEKTLEKIRNDITV